MRFILRRRHTRFLVYTAISCGMNISDVGDIAVRYVGCGRASLAVWYSLYLVISGQMHMITNPVFEGMIEIGQSCG